MEKLVWIQYDLPYYLYLIPDGSYRVRLKNKEADIIVRKGSKSPEEVKRTTLSAATFVSSDQELPPEEIEKLADKQIHGRYSHSMINKDRRGFMHYSTIRVVFEFDKDEESTLDESLQIKEESLKFLNRLIEIYRVATDEEWVEPIISSDIIKMEIERIVGREGEKLICQRTIAAKFPYGSQVGGIPYLTASKLDAFMRRLLADEEIPIHQLLILDARNYLNKFNYRMSMLNACLAFETFLNEIIESNKCVLAEAGITDTQINKASLSKKATEYIKYICGESFENAAFWGSDIVFKYKRIRDSRNAVAHEGKVQYRTDSILYNVESVDEGKNHIAMVADLISKISEKLASP